MGDGVGFFLARDFDHAPGYQRPGDAGAEEILGLVNRARLDHREYEIARERFLQIVDINLRRAGRLRLRGEAPQLLLLADIRAEGDHLRAVFFFDPGKKHRGVEPARICQNNFHRGCKSDGE